MKPKFQPTWHLGLCLAVLAAGSAAGQTWPDALSGMPLAAPVPELNRTNCVDLFLRSFRSNAAVKALVFMPGATDEFYLFRRVTARLDTPSPSLFDAVCALTNQTFIRATFRSPMLLLHTEEDPLEPEVTIGDPAVPARFKARTLPHLCFHDRDWDTVQPALKWPLRADIRPWRHSRDSWHFYRHSFAAWNLDGWEALLATALSGKAKLNARSKQVVFEPDPRVRATPKAKHWPPPGQ